MKTINAMADPPQFNMKQSDMGAMYNSLSQDDILHNVTEVCERTWTRIAGKLHIPINDLRCSVRWSNEGCFNGAVWHDPACTPSGAGQTLAFSDVKNLIDIAVKNNIVLIDGHYFRQNAGVGMGNPASPLLATLCCANVEFTKRETLETDTEARRAVLNFAFRYVDDCLSAEEVELPTSAEYHVPLKETRGLEKSLFLGVEIVRREDNRFEFGVIRKSETFQHQVPRFPHATSNHPTHIRAASTTGNLVHIFARSSDLDRFYASAKELFCELKGQRGYEAELLHKAVGAFCSTHIQGNNKKAIRTALHKAVRFAYSTGLPGGSRSSEDAPLCRCGHYHFGKCARCWHCGRWQHIRAHCPFRHQQRDNDTTPKSHRNQTQRQEPNRAQPSTPTQRHDFFVGKRSHTPKASKDSTLHAPYSVLNAGNTCFFASCYQVASCVNNHKVSIDRRPTRGN